MRILLLKTDFSKHSVKFDCKMYQVAPHKARATCSRSIFTTSTICYFFIATAQFKVRTRGMMVSMSLFHLLFVSCCSNLIIHCYRQNDSHLEDLLSDLMAYFQSKSIVIHSNKMNVFKSMTFQGYVCILYNK